MLFYILFMDNASSHLDTLGDNLSNIKIIFLPKNTLWEGTMVAHVFSKVRWHASEFSPVGSRGNSLTKAELYFLINTETRP